MSRRRKLISEGWEERFAAHGARLKEAVELFEQMGYEVRLEPPELPEDGLPDESCKSCILNKVDKVIFVRRSGSQQ